MCSSPILTVIFVQSLSSGQIPKDWLTANITPIFKKGDQGDPSNYRPISLISVCCKILEHIIHRYIMEHLNANRILDTNQFGFRVGHSSEQQLISMIEEIQSAMDCRHQADVIFLDFQKAFDTVSHQRLLKKLNHYGIRGNIYNWLDTIYWRVKYLANWSVIVVGVTLIWQKAVAAIHIIAIKLYWHHLNLADGRKIAKSPN